MMNAQIVFERQIDNSPLNDAVHATSVSLAGGFFHLPTEL